MIDIVKIRKIPFAISAVLVIASVALLATFGLKQGIDFTGGSLMEVTFTAERPDASAIRETVAPLEEDYGTILVQPTGEDAALLRTSFLTEQQHQSLLETLQEAYPAEDGSVGVVEDRFETIGPTISEQLRSRSLSAGIVVIIAIILYIGYAFRKVSRPVASWKYGITAIVALVHDTVITMGVFAVLGKYYGVEIDIPFVVALLTIMGYSVNDTIVLFDRVRENLLKLGGKDFGATVAAGIRQSITRSMNTSLTTLLVLFSLLLFGGDSIHYFALALIIGIISGTYSSIFLASPLLVEWHNRGLKKRRK